MPTREELIEAVERKRLIKAVEAKREQQGMAAATKMADKGGDQEGIEATTQDRIRGLAGGVEQGVSMGFADTLKVPGDYVSDVVQGEKFGTTTDTRRARESDIKSKAPMAHTVGDVAGSMALPLGGLKKAGQAAIGGIEGAGRTDDLFSLQGAKDVGIGAGLGFTLGAGGEMVGKGLQKLGKGAKNLPDKVPTGSEIREGAIHKTPTVRKREQRFPAEKAKSEAAIAAGEKHGVFKGAPMDELVLNTQDKLKEVGSSLDSTVKESTKALGEAAVHTKPPALLSAQGKLDAHKKRVTDLMADGEFDNTDGKKVIAIFDEEFGRLKDMIGRKGSSLEAIRKLKTGIYKRLKGADFIPPGPKAGSHKDALLEVAGSLRDMEREALGTLNELLVKKGTGTEEAMRLTAAHADNLKDYGSLSILEDQLAGTVDKQVGSLGLKEIAAAGVAGLPGAVIQASQKKLSTPKGRLFLAKIADAYHSDPGKAKRLTEAAAKMLGVPIEAIGTALRSNKAIPAAAIAQEKMGE